MIYGALTTGRDETGTHGAVHPRKLCDLSASFSAHTSGAVICGLWRREIVCTFSAERKQTPRKPARCVLSGLSSAWEHANSPTHARTYAQFPFAPSGYADLQTKPPPCSACPTRSALSPVPLTGSERGGHPGPGPGREAHPVVAGLRCMWPSRVPTCKRQQRRRERGPADGEVARRPVSHALTVTTAGEGLRAPGPRAAEVRPAPARPALPRLLSLLRSPALCRLPFAQSARAGRVGSGPPAQCRAASRGQGAAGALHAPACPPTPLPQPTRTKATSAPRSAPATRARVQPSVSASSPQGDHKPELRAPRTRVKRRPPQAQQPAAVPRPAGRARPRRPTRCWASGPCVAARIPSPWTAWAGGRQPRTFCFTRQPGFLRGGDSAALVLEIQILYL